MQKYYVGLHDYVGVEVLAYCGHAGVCVLSPLFYHLAEPSHCLTCVGLLWPYVTFNVHSVYVNPCVD